MDFGEIRALFHGESVDVFDWMALLNSKNWMQSEQREYVRTHSMRINRWSGRVTELCRDELRWQQAGFDSHQNIDLVKALAHYARHEWIPTNVQEEHVLKQAIELADELIHLMQNHIDVDTFRLFTDSKFVGERAPKFLRSSKKGRYWNLTGAWLTLIAGMRLTPERSRRDLVALLEGRDQFRLKDSPLKSQGDYWRSTKEKLGATATRVEIGKAISKQLRVDRKIHRQLWFDHFDVYIRTKLVEYGLVRCVGVHE